jgi:hypothetical protein
LVWYYISEPLKPKLPADSSEENSAGIFKMLAQRNIVLCAVIGSLIVGSAVVGSIFYPVFLTLDRGYSNAEMSTMMAVLGLCPPVGGILVPYLSDRFGRKPLMIIFCGLMTITPLAVVYFSGPRVPSAGVCGVRDRGGALRCIRRGRIDRDAQFGVVAAGDVAFRDREHFACGAVQAACAVGEIDAEAGVFAARGRFVCECGTNRNGNGGGDDGGTEHLISPFGSTGGAR